MGQCEAVWRELLPGQVYVVDDDASFRTAIERRLKKAGYEVATYSSAQHLLDRLPSEGVPAAFSLDGGEIDEVISGFVPDIGHRR